jgi:hypothetical protein
VWNTVPVRTLWNRNKDPALPEVNPSTLVFQPVVYSVYQQSYPFPIRRIISSNLCHVSRCRPSVFSITALNTYHTNVLYIWTHVWQRWEPSFSICCTTSQHWMNYEYIPVSYLCVNTISNVWFLPHKLRLVSQIYLAQFSKYSSFSKSMHKI